MQTKQVNVRLSDDEIGHLRELAKGCEVTTAALGGFFMRAALRAVREHGGPFRLPPFFELKDHDPDPRFKLNEPRGKNRK